jgi:biopolymer transport protein ExbD
MKIPRRAVASEASINMTPMIDVVFQLIIFFLVTSHFAKQEAHLPLPLPGADSATALKDDSAPRLVINVTADGTPLFSGRALSPAELQQRLGERIAELGKDTEVRIRADRSVAYRHIEPVLLACARAGIWNVNYAVYRREDVK